MRRFRRLNESHNQCSLSDIRNILDKIGRRNDCEADDYTAMDVMQMLMNADSCILDDILSNLQYYYRTNYSNANKYNELEEQGFTFYKGYKGFIFGYKSSDVNLDIRPVNDEDEDAEYWEEFYMNLDDITIYIFDKNKQYIGKAYNYSLSDFTVKGGDRNYYYGHIYGHFKEDEDYVNDIYDGDYDLYNDLYKSFSRFIAYLFDMYKDDDGKSGCISNWIQDDDETEEKLSRELFKEHMF